VIHPPWEPSHRQAGQVFWESWRRSLDALEPFARRQGVRLALENLVTYAFHTIERALSLYGPEFLGLCYDSGHGHFSGSGLEQLDLLKQRLLALHLNDNDGTGDHHQLPFSGKVDWPRLAGILAASDYRGCLTLEVVQDPERFPETGRFLVEARQQGEALAALLAEHGWHSAVT
jgi:sugar phosphate isomerase/epimerase